MPIQFQCPHCQHAMQLPDTAAGKQGKCPKCSNAVTVPAARGSAPPNPHDEEFWSELDEKKEAVHDEGEAPKPVKKSDAQILKHMLGKAEAEKAVKRIGMPWERPEEGGMFDRFWDTAIAVFNQPQNAFSEMKLQGGMGKPFTFLLVGQTTGFLMQAVYAVCFAAIIIISNATEESPLVAGAIAVTLVIAFFVAFIGGLIGAIIQLFLQAGLIHLFLKMVGVSDKPFETAFRVTAFANGSIALCQFLPAIGIPIMLFFWFFTLTKGLAAAFVIPGNKAFIAVFLTFVIALLPIVGPAFFLALSWLYS